MRVVENRFRSGSEAAVAPSAVAAAEPLVVIFLEPETQGYIEISESAPPHRLVTVIEFLSLSNKYAGKGREMYLQKQTDLYEAGVSMVEVDLLRAGPHVLQLPPAQDPPACRTPYKVCVHRTGRASAEIYKAPLREKLPAIRIPLRSTDPDSPLDLQALIVQVYRHGRYDDTDYTIPPIPPLEGDDAQWGEEMLRAAGRRPA